MKQVHGTTVTRVGASARERGVYSYETGIEATDALITNEKRVGLCVLVADCVPILIFDPRNHAIAVVHAGRKGTISGIAKLTLESMHHYFGTRPDDVLVGLGLSISAKRYSVSGAGQTEITRNGYADFLGQQSTGEITFDLYGANRKSLDDAGVNPSSVEQAEFCTYVASDLLFSERRDGVPTGRFCAGIIQLEA